MTQHGSKLTTDTIFVDGHVHMHAHFDPENFLEVAARNFSAAAEAYGLPATTPGMLLLADTEEFDAFGLLTAGALPKVTWQIESLAEQHSFVARRPDRPPIFVIGGRQIQVREGLEVLAHGTRDLYPDGLPVREVLGRMVGDDVVTIIPWGFGKWWLRRGRTVRQVLVEYGGKGVHVGDHGARLRGSPRPPLLEFAERRGMLVLSGSGPLPLAAEVTRIGGFGFIARPRLDPERPRASLRAWLGEQTRSPEEFGALAPLSIFVQRQTTQQIRKRYFLFKARLARFAGTYASGHRGS